MTVDQHYINSTDGKSDDIYTHNLPSSKQLILCKGAFLVKVQKLIASLCYLTFAMRKYSRLKKISRYNT